MFFFKSFCTLFLLNILFYNNTFCGCSSDTSEIVKTEIVNYIGLDDVQAMSINQPSCYCLIKENTETKVKDISIKISTIELKDNEFIEVPKDFNLKLEEDCLKKLRIAKVAEGYYILLVYDEKTNEAIYLHKPYTGKVLLLSNKNILTVDKIKKGIESLNKNIEVDFIFKINEIKGLKIYKDPVELKIK